MPLKILNVSQGDRIPSNLNLAKLDDGLNESPTVMVGEAASRQLSKNSGILKPSWA
jgi:hypothetical protein